MNLILEVGKRRADGYHEIASLIVPLSLHDTLKIESAAENISTSVLGEGLPSGDIGPAVDSGNNLATRAGIALKEFSGYSGGASITISKRIPTGGGLGGGSADAAAALKGLNRLWRTGLSESDLQRLASGLGSDVPATLHGKAVAAEGMGDRITPVRLRGESGSNGWWLVLVNPGFGVSTRDIYERHSSALTSPGGRLKSMVCALADGDLDSAARGLFNALEDVVFSKYPLLAMIAGALRDAGALGVLLCGSGSSVFALARDELHGDEIERRFTESFKMPLWSRVVRTVPDGVMVAHGPLEA